MSVVVTLCFPAVSYGVNVVNLYAFLSRKSRYGDVQLQQRGRPGPAPHLLSIATMLRSTSRRTTYVCLHTYSYVDLKA